MATIPVQNLKVICKQIIPLISFSITPPFGTDTSSQLLVQENLEQPSTNRVTAYNIRTIKNCTLFRLKFVRFFFSFFFFLTETFTLIA